MDEARPGRPDVSFDRRAPDPGTQFEQVGVALQQLRQTQDSLRVMEARLAQLTRECEGILARWSQNDERHAAAVVELHTRLSEWNDIERRLLTESAARVQQFERSLQHEWTALKQKHEVPLQELEAQRVRITEACLSAVDQALKGFDRAESRITSLEQQIQQEMSDLSQEVRSALDDLRQERPAFGPPRQSWSLDNVVRLHNELRPTEESTSSPGTEVAGTGTLGLAPSAVRALRALDTATRVPPAEPARTEDRPAEPAVEPVLEPPRPRWRLAPLVAVLAVAAAVGYSLYLRNEVTSSLRDATSRIEAAERTAAESRDQARQEIASAQQAADERLDSAQQVATTAQMMTAIVAARDVRRFDLVAVDGQTPSVQVLWSRSTGIALNASQLPAPPAGRAYQLWMLTRTVPASIGVFVPNPDGSASAAFPWPADLQRAVIGASITVEPGAGSPQPTGPARMITSFGTDPTGTE